MRFTRPYVFKISATMATSPNQHGVVGTASGAIWIWTEACVILRVYPPYELTCVCRPSLLRRHLFHSFDNDSPLLSTLFLMLPACSHLVAQLVGFRPPPQGLEDCMADSGESDLADDVLVI